MKILVINCGSSSVKYKLFDMASQAPRACGLIDRIAQAQATILHQADGQQTRLTEPMATVDAAVGRILQLLTTVGDRPALASVAELAGVGHRVVHGGEELTDSTVVDQCVLAAIERCVPLSPQHNPANLAGLRAAMELAPGVPQVAVFDTAFFASLPPTAYLYAVPRQWYQRYGVRRYGFHGTSHRFVAGRAAQLLGIRAPNLITLHLGNGCSAAAIANGRAVDQSMGLTPLEGLVMGTRSGDLDPAIIFHLLRQGLSPEAVQHTLEKESGLLGLSGVSGDLRDVQHAAEAGHPQAALALEVFAHRARKYVGAFLAELGTCHALVFTGGIGENAAPVRAKILTGLEALGIELDDQRNRGAHGGGERVISATGSRIAVWVIPTNEELLIARDTAALVGDPRGH